MGLLPKKSEIKNQDLIQEKMSPQEIQQIESALHFLIDQRVREDQAKTQEEWEDENKN